METVAFKIDAGTAAAAAAAALAALFPVLSVAIASRWSPVMRCANLARLQATLSAVTLAIALLSEGAKKPGPVLTPQRE
jgi:hypothetical protein